jgi:hypothetical protein
MKRTWMAAMIMVFLGASPALAERPNPDQEITVEEAEVLDVRREGPTIEIIGGQPLETQPSLLTVRTDFLDALADSAEDL